MGSQRHSLGVRAKYTFYVEHFYNRQRRPSHLGGKSPEVFESGFTATP